MKVVCYKKNYETCKKGTSERKNCTPTLTPPRHMSCKNICKDTDTCPYENLFYL